MFNYVEYISQDESKVSLMQVISLAPYQLYNFSLFVCIKEGFIPVVNILIVYKILIGQYEYWAVNFMNKLSLGQREEPGIQKYYV